MHNSDFYKNYQTTLYKCSETQRMELSDIFWNKFENAIAVFKENYTTWPDEKLPVIPGYPHKRLAVAKHYGLSTYCIERELALEIAQNDNYARKVVDYLLKMENMRINK